MAGIEHISQPMGELADTDWENLFNGGILMQDASVGSSHQPLRVNQDLVPSTTPFGLANEAPNNPVHRVVDDGSGIEDLRSGYDLGIGAADQHSHAALDQNAWPLPDMWNSEHPNATHDAQRPYYASPPPQPHTETPSAYPGFFDSATATQTPYLHTQAQPAQHGQHATLPTRKQNYPNLTQPQHASTWPPQNSMQHYQVGSDTMHPLYPGVMPLQDARPTFIRSFNGEDGDAPFSGVPAFNAGAIQDENTNHVTAVDIPEPIDPRTRFVCPLCHKNFKWTKHNRGKMCTQCTRAEVKKLATNVTYAFDFAMDEAAALERLHPTNQPLGLPDDDFHRYADPRLYAQGSQYWVKEFLDACNTHTPGDDPNHEDQAYYHSQQQAYNVSRFTPEDVNMRLRLLYLVAFRYHAGGPSVYPTGGDNGGYSPNPDVKFQTRLRHMRDLMRLDKRVCIDILHGRGAVAFTQNPHTYQRRKVQNKHGNAKKDEMRKLGEEVAEGGQGDDTGDTALTKRKRGGGATRGRKRKQAQMEEEPVAGPSSKRQQTSTPATFEPTDEPLYTFDAAAKDTVNMRNTNVDPWGRQLTAAFPVATPSVPGLTDRSTISQSPGAFDADQLDFGSPSQIEPFDHDRFINEQLHMGLMNDGPSTYQTQHAYGAGENNTNNFGVPSTQYASNQDEFFAYVQQQSIAGQGTQAATRTTQQQQPVDLTTDPALRDSTASQINDEAQQAIAGAPQTPQQEPVSRHATISRNGLTLPDLRALNYNGKGKAPDRG